MAACCQTLVRGAHALSINRCLHLRWRRAHTQSLWEELLGRKIEPAAAKKLEEAFLEYRVRKAVPSWLPFLPNSSFWIPSTEETIKNLEILAERMKLARPSRKQRVNVYKSPPDWSSENGSVSTVAAWSVIQQTDRLLSSANSNGIPSVDVLLKSSVEKGTVIEVEVEDEDLDEDDDDIEEDGSESDEKQKPEGA